MQSPCLQKQQKVQGVFQMLQHLQKNQTTQLYSSGETMFLVAFISNMTLLYIIFFDGLDYLKESMKPFQGCQFCFFKEAKIVYCARKEVFFMQVATVLSAEVFLYMTIVFFIIFVRCSLCSTVSSPIVIHNILKIIPVKGVPKPLP